MITIKDTYVDKDGNNYNIRNINLTDMYNIGTYITETKRETGGFWSDDDNLENGVYIFKTNYDPNKALRIYKDNQLYKYVYHNDVKYISKLTELQKNIKLTEFPTGIVTRENYVIGQEIPFYENYETLYSQLNNIKDKEKLFYFYKKIIDILEELINNGILYKDLHAKNFMIKGESIKLIDFEDTSFSFSDNKKLLIENLRLLINYINNYLKIDYKVNSETLDGLKEEITVKSKRL